MLNTRTLGTSLDRMLTLNRALDQAFNGMGSRVWVPALDVATEGEVRVFAAERVHGSFERAVRLPEFVDADRIDAAFTNGLLSITVPKAQAAQPRKITIRGAEQADKQQIAG